MERDLGLYKQLKRCRTMNEIAQCIPDCIYDRGTELILLYWCLVPVFSMIYSYITRIDADLLIYLSVIGSGILGIYLMILRALKENVLQSLRDESYVIKHLSQLALLFMLIWSLFSCLLARDKYHAFIGDVYSHEGFLTYVAYAGFYGSAVFLNNKNIFKKVLNLFCWIGTVLSFLTILQYYGIHIRAFSGYMKLAATFHNTNHFGYYLTLTILCSGAFFVVAKSLKEQMIYLIQFIIMISALIFNNTFGSYLGVLGGSLIMIIIFYCCKGQLKIKFFVPFITIMIISLVINVTSGIVDHNFEVLKQDTVEILNETEQSAHAGSGRWQLWTNAVKFTMERPLVGYGPDNLDYNYAQVGINMLKPHNEYLQHAATLGIPALIFYLISLVNLYIHGIKHKQELDTLVIISFCVISGYLISAFVGNTKFYVTPYFMIFLALATKVKLEKEEANV